MRPLLIGLVLLGIVGLIAELLLMEHYDDWEQIIPLAALGLGLAGAGAAAYHPTRRTVRSFQAVMAAFVLTGVVGLWLHYRGNADFEAEIAPALRGGALVWKSLRGAVPILAPGALVQIGLLGLIWSHDHPALGPGASTTTRRNK